MGPDEARARLGALGYGPADVETLFAHFDDAERRGKLGHGHARIEWLGTQEVDPAARAVKVVSEPGFERWEARGRLGYLVLAEICADLVASEPRPVRVVAADAFPTGHLGYWVRGLAEAGLVALLTATSPAGSRTPRATHRSSARTRSRSRCPVRRESRSSATSPWAPSPTAT